MAVHHGKEGEVVVGGSAVGELVSFTLETTGDVVESTKMADAAKTFVAGRTSFSGTLEMHFDEADSVQTQLTAGSSITFKLLLVILPILVIALDHIFADSVSITVIGFSYAPIFYCFYYGLPTLRHSFLLSCPP